MINRKLFIIIVFAIILGYLSGCTTAKYVHDSYNAQEIDRIAILPFMDNRENPDPKLGFAKITSSGSHSLIFPLKYNKKYRTVLSGDIGNVSSYSVQDLPFRNQKSVYADTIDSESVDPEWIKQLGPSTEQWVLIPVLEEISIVDLLIMRRGVAEVSVYLFNKQTGELWWQRSVKYNFTEDLLTRALTKAITTGDDVLEDTVLFMAAFECIKALPKRTGPYLLPDK